MIILNLLELAMKKFVIAMTMLLSTPAFASFWQHSLVGGDYSWGTYNWDENNQTMGKNADISIQVHCGENIVVINTAQEYGLLALRGPINEQNEPLYMYWFNFAEKGEFPILTNEVTAQPSGISFNGAVAKEFIELLMSGRVMTHENYTVALDGSSKAIKPTCGEKFIVR
ncbi:MAG: hypothetical protein DBW67_06660 [SAR116 cluster bacterium]|nr:MAG: hypothetical protein DBW67_06660 [SAR116 cluster bacterium]HBQ22368.1 hypothetical protein [Alphaproteobacteria bacterium]